MVLSDDARLYLAPQVSLHASFGGQQAKLGGASKIAAAPLCLACLPVELNLREAGKARALMSGPDALALCIGDFH